MSCSCAKLKPGALWQHKVDQNIATIVSRLPEDHVLISVPLENVRAISEIELAETHDYVGRHHGR